MHVLHTLSPIYDAESKILILGSMPSIVSRSKNCYYAHPQNQFWKLLSDVYKENITDKEKFLHNTILHFGMSLKVVISKAQKIVLFVM